jgi:hypothetical protein
MVTPITIDTIQKNLLSDRLFRERRYPQWTLNYELSRDTAAERQRAVHEEDAQDLSHADELAGR